MSQNRTTRINIAPVPKPRMTQADRWKKRPATTRYWDFKDRLKAQVSGELEPTFTVAFFIPMPASWSKKKRLEMSGRPHQQKPDVDNFLKAFMDSLCEDDSYVYDVRAQKYWAEEGAIELTEAMPVDFSLFIEASVAGRQLISGV